jgi:hypothetical protein
MLVISTDDQNRVHAGSMELAPLSGAVTR